jgi:carboxylate-amine ligase
VLIAPQALQVSNGSKVMSNNNASRKFGFGIEAEYLLLDQNFRPLFAEDLDFETLRDCVDSIPTTDLGTDGFNIKPLHKHANPYLIEGYYLTDEQMKPHTLLPKGIEVRTPMRSSIDETISVLADATERLRSRVESEFGYHLCTISHHPTKSNFQAAPNYKRHDYWQWALAAMTTFGPDINISLPEKIAAEVDQKALNERINFYMPAVVALTFSSPLIDGKLWKEDGIAGKSVRTYKRSQWAPLYYVHTEPALRFEFKGFEMPLQFSDYRAFFLLSLALLLDPSLTLKTGDEERIANLRYFAVHGLDSEASKVCARTLLKAAERTALRLSLDASCLSPLWRRLEAGNVPADQISRAFRTETSLEKALEHFVVKPAASAFGVNSAHATSMPR